MAVNTIQTTVMRLAANLRMVRTGSVVFAGRLGTAPGNLSHAERHQPLAPLASFGISARSSGNKPDHQWPNPEERDDLRVIQAGRSVGCLFGVSGRFATMAAVRQVPSGLKRTTYSPVLACERSARNAMLRTIATRLALLPRIG